MGNMAKIYMFRKEYDTAKRLMLESIAINEKPGNDNMDALYVKLNLSEVYGHTNAYEKMYSVLKQIGFSIDSVKGVRETKVDLEWRYNMYRYFRYVNKPMEALRWVDSFQKLKDTIDAAQKKYSQTIISQLLESQETKYQNELLKKERYVGRLYLTVTISLGLMAIVIGVLIYLNYRRSKRNVIELIALNKEVNTQKIQLQQIVNEKDTILHIVAHDLRDPIGGINYLAHYIYERETDELLKKQLSVIEHTSQSSLALINELVEMSDLTRQHGVWEKDNYDMNELVKTIVTMLEFKAKEKEQQLIATYARMPVFIYVHKEKILRALCNIVSNAIKFSNRGGDVYINIDASGKNVIVSVKDSGIGIPEKMSAIVFNQFTGAKRRGTEGEKSYGLGLSVSKKIVTEEGGRLWYDSEENKGTTFYLEFPVRQG
jgi:signal transduction histidine kinase